MLVYIKSNRIYRISAKKQRKRSEGMFDIINRHSPMKLMPWYDHQVHGIYEPEEALVDAVQTQSFRAILASMRLFNHVKDWPKLYSLAKEKGIWPKIGALYDLSKIFLRVRRMPNYYRKINHKRVYMIGRYPTSEPKFKIIEKKWNVAIPFRKADLQRVAA